MRLVRTFSAEETAQFARKLALELPADATLLFFGDLASGKTTFIKGLASAFDVPVEQVTSPTFVYLNIYEGLRPIYHFDLWRLKSKEEFFSLGFDEFLMGPGIKCIEWSERLDGFEFDQVIKITFSSFSESERQITVEGI